MALFLIVPRLAGQKQALEYLKDATVAWLIVAVLVECVALLFYSLLFRRLLRLLHWPVTLPLALRINLAGLAAAHLFSAGGVGGWVITYNALMKYTVPHGIIFVAIAAQQFFNYIVLWLFFAMAMIYLIVTRGGGSILG